MQKEAGDLLKSSHHLALSYRQHLNGFSLMLPYSGPVDFLYPMGNGIFVRGIRCAKELIRKRIKRDRGTIRPHKDNRITLAKRIGPTGAPIVLDNALPHDSSNVLGKRLSIEG